MHFLVVDTRFQSPVYVFLEEDPHTDAGFPGLSIRNVNLELNTSEPGRSSGVVVGQHPHRSDEFRLFRSDGAAIAAGFGVIEPRFVGSTWSAYSRAFGFGTKRLAR